MPHEITTSEQRKANDQEKHPVHKTLTEHLPAPLVDETVTGGTTITFIGHAAIGTSTSDPLWKILRVTEVVNGGNTITTTEYADTDVKYDNIWDDRANLKYGR